MTLCHILFGELCLQFLVLLSQSNKLLLKLHQKLLLICLARLQLLLHLGYLVVLLLALLLHLCEHDLQNTLLRLLRLRLNFLFLFASLQLTLKFNDLFAQLRHLVQKGVLFLSMSFGGGFQRFGLLVIGGGV